jgi:cell division septal protein FtsQ
MKLKKKSRWKNRAVFLLALISVLSAAVWGTVWAARRLADIRDVHPIDRLFVVRSIQVGGVSPGRAADVRGVIKKQTNLSLGQLDPEKIQEALMRLPWIKEVQLRKEWPDALVVMVMEREPFAWVEDRAPVRSEKARYRLVDDDGVEMESLGRPAGGFPLVHLASNVSDPGRTRLKAGIQTLKAFEVSGVEPEALEEAVVEVRDPQDVVLHYKGLSLRLGFGDPKEQIRRFLFVKQELLARSPEISEVDLRFPGRLIVRSKIENKQQKYRAAVQTGFVKGEAAPRPYTERR